MPETCHKRSVISLQPGHCVPLICLNEFKTLFWPFLFSFYQNNKVLKHITSAECIYVSHCEFLLNRTRGMTLLFQCFVRLSNAFEEILPWILLAIIKIYHCKTALGWLDRKWNWFETFVFHHQFPVKDKLVQLMGKYHGTLVPTFCWSPRKLDKTAVCALILSSPGAEVILVQLSSLVSVLWCRIKDLAFQQWIPEKSNQENTSKAYKCISAVAHDSIHSKVARTSLFQKWVISCFNIILQQSYPFLIPARGWNTFLRRSPST